MYHDDRDQTAVKPEIGQMSESKIEEHQKDMCARKRELNLESASKHAAMHQCCAQGCSDM